MELRSQGSMVPMILHRKLNFNINSNANNNFQTIFGFRFGPQHLRVFYLRARTTDLEYPTESSV